MHWSITIALLGLGITVHALAQPPVPLKEAVLKMAGDLKQGKKGDPVAVARLADGSVEDVMALLKPAKKGGLKIGVIDGIERFIIGNSRDPLTEEKTKALQGDVHEVSLVLRAFAEVIDEMGPKSSKIDRVRKAWRERVEEMRQASQALQDASRTTDPVRWKAAALGVNKACNECHVQVRAGLGRN